MFEVFEHTADLGLRVQAPSLDALFAEAARGLFSILVTNLNDVQCVLERRYDLQDDECDYLLFDWLDELLYTFETENLLFARFDVSIDEHGLHATARGEPMDLQRHHMDHEVKAITYHGLQVEQSGDVWFAELIVDI